MSYKQDTIIGSSFRARFLCWFTSSSFWKQWEFYKWRDCQFRAHNTKHTAACLYSSVGLKHIPNFMHCFLRHIHWNGLLHPVTLVQRYCSDFLCSYLVLPWTRYATVSQSQAAKTQKAEASFYSFSSPQYLVQCFVLLCLKKMLIKCTEVRRL